MITVASVRAILSGIAFLALVQSCTVGDRNVPSVWPQRAVVPYAEVAVEGGEVPFSMGGFGSDMAFSAVDTTFWLLTDRGPNVDGRLPDSKVFLQPDFVPCIGVFRCEGDTLRRVRTIALRDSTGRPFCGLPNVSEGATGETAFSIGGDVLSVGTQKGIDPEGLALMPDGSFWVSDEYGPFLMHFSADGRCMQVRSPFNGGLPAAYAHRRPNRGMEGLCANRTGTLLYGMLQSPMPESAAYASADELPLCVISLATDEMREYLYPLDRAAEGVSALACVNDSTLLVLERDGAFPVDGKGFKRIYRVSLPQAVPGRPVRLDKVLEVDVLQAVPGYVHDKAEGMALVGDSVIVVVNDDDFGVATGDGEMPYKPKLNPSGRLDFNELVFIRHRMEEQMDGGPRQP